MDDEPDQRPEGRASRRALKTRQRLLDAALYIFNTKGVEGCAIEDITESADVGKGTFYRHFMDKLDILRTLLDVSTDDLIKRMPAESAPAISFDDRVTQLIQAHLTFFTERSDLFILFLQGQTMVATRPASLPGLHAPYARYISAIETRIAASLPATVLPDQKRQIASLLAAAACGPVTVGLSISSSKHDVIKNLDLARQSLLAGIKQVLLK
jgi:AcrR family transcriptional regulator